MMMADDKKKHATIIIARMQKGKAPQESSDAKEEPMQGPEDMMGLETAAEDIMSALHAKDPKALVSSLKHFMEMCDYSSSEQEPSSEDASEPSEE
jgi:hypothetical protein